MTVLRLIAIQEGDREVHRRVSLGRPLTLIYLNHASAHLL